LYIFELMILEFIPTALRVALKVTEFVIFDKDTGTLPPLRLMQSLIIMESITLTERTFPNNLGRENISQRKHTHTHTHTHTHASCPTTINTCGGQHPAGSVPGAGTMSHHPFHDLAGLSSQRPKFLRSWPSCLLRQGLSLAWVH
jgi:hypothetical protein